MIFIRKHGNQIAEHMRRRRKAVQEQNGGSIPGTGFAIEDFQPLHVKRAIENGRGARICRVFPIHYRLSFFSCHALLSLFFRFGIVFDIETLPRRVNCTVVGARQSPRPHGRTRMIVFPLIRSVRLKAATASSRAATLPMFVRSRPTRTRWTSSLNRAQSGMTTKSTVRPPEGRASVGPVTVTSVPPERIRPADRFA